MSTCQWRLAGTVMNHKTDKVCKRKAEPNSMLCAEHLKQGWERVRVLAQPRIPLKR